MKSPRILIFAKVLDQTHDLMGFLPGWVRALQHAGASVAVVTYGSRHSKVVRLWTAVRELWKLRDEYDVVFVVMAPTWAMFLAPFVRVMGKRIYLWYAVWRGSWKLRAAERLVNGIFCSVPESFPFPSRKVRAVGQAIDTELFSPGDGQRIAGQILFLGRISPVKRIEVLLQAVAMLQEQRIVIAGGPISADDRRYEQELHTLARRLGLDDSVTWLGRVGHDATPDLYRRADIVVNMTPAGSFDKTMLEAMSSGAILVASNPALRNLLPESVADRILFRQDDPNDLARVLSDIMSLSDNEKDAIRTAMREAVMKNHSISQWANNIIKAME